MKYYSCCNHVFKNRCLYLCRHFQRCRLSIRWSSALFVSVRQAPMLPPPAVFERNHDSSLTRRAYSWLGQRGSKAVHRETPEKVVDQALSYIEPNFFVYGSRILLNYRSMNMYFHWTNREWVSSIRVSEIAVSLSQSV